MYSGYLASIYIGVWCVCMYYIFSLSICALLLLLPFFLMNLLIFQKLYIFVLMIILVILNFLSTFFFLLLSIGSLTYTWLKLASKFISHSISLASNLKNFPFIPNFTYKFIKWTYFTYTNHFLVISQILYNILTYIVRLYSHYVL